MASPVGHVLVAVLTGRTRIARGRPVRVWLSFAAFAAIAPDLDFVPGMLAGDVNRFHHGASHSLAAVALFGAAVASAAAAWRLSPWHWGLAGAALYASHLALDVLTADGRPPIGLPLLWPLTSEPFAAARPLLAGIRHGSADGSIGSFFADVLSAHNARAALREVLILGPVVALLWTLALHARRPSAATGPARERTGATAGAERRD